MSEQYNTPEYADAQQAHAQALYEEFLDLKADNPGRAADYYFLIVHELVRHATPATLAALQEATAQTGVLWPNWPPPPETPFTIMEIG